MSANIGKNHSIQCSITECQNHCPSGNYCALDSIQVGAHDAETEPESDLPECNETDCHSFRGSQQW